MNKGNCVALGVFDGFHIGHRAVIGPAVERASRTGERALVTRFDVHPQEYFDKGKTPYLMTFADSAAYIASLGAGELQLSLGEVAEMSPESFFRDILVGKYGASFVSCGYNFTFGRGRTGNAELLGELCREAGVELFVAPEIKLDGLTVSSSAIRRNITEGNIRLANAMLGRRFSYSGVVVGGEKLGRRMGFPTANIALPPDLVVPRYGVYASFADIDGRKLPSVTNIGVKPTVGFRAVGSETHIIGFDGDLYGRKLGVELIGFIRPEMSFSSMDGLRDRISSDAAEAADICAGEIDNRR